MSADADKNEWNVETAAFPQNRINRFLLKEIVITADFFLCYDKESAFELRWIYIVI